MIEVFEDKYYKNLRVDCEKCFGLCCIALYFSASDGFPTDKTAGKPCINLQEDFRCSVHSDLKNQGLKGCTGYDCFGAGQKVAQTTFGGRSWRETPEISEKIFELFLKMKQLHEFLWYLTDALVNTKGDLKEEISNMLKKTEKLTLMDADNLASLDVLTHRIKVNELLKKTSDKVRKETRNASKIFSKCKKLSVGRRDYFGANLKNTDLIGADLRGACLIAADLRGVDLSGADLIGADLRDADLRGTNLRNAIFLTQGQINSAIGDSKTLLPKSLITPTCW